MTKNSCIKYVDMKNMNKYNYVFNLKNPDNIANYCLNIPSIDMRHPEIYNKCMKIVSETKQPVEINMFHPYDLSKPNEKICNHMEIRKCYDKK